MGPDSVPESAVKRPVLPSGRVPRIIRSVEEVDFERICEHGPTGITKGVVLPYQREISRDHKACILFLLDQSYSMVEPLGGSSHRKCDELAKAVNAWLYNMSIRASGNEGVRDYMDVGVIGYRTDQQASPIIGPALVGPLAGRELISITDIGNYPARIDTVVQQIRDEETGELMEFPSESPIWVDPVAEGSTPMCHVLYHAYQILSQWIQQHPDSFPPIVIHISDGESQDGDPVPYAEAIKAWPLRTATSWFSTVTFR